MNNELIQLTDEELSRVGGGFLPLLGLIGAGSGIAGKILGGIGQKKAKQAEEIMNSLPNGNAGGGNGGAGGGAAASPQGSAAAAPTGGNLLAQPMAMAPSGGGGG